MLNIPPDLFYAWLGAPTEDQRWEIYRQMERQYFPGKGHVFAVHLHYYQRSGFGELETILRRFWNWVAFNLCNPPDEGILFRGLLPP